MLGIPEDGSKKYRSLVASRAVIQTISQQQDDDDEDEDEAEMLESEDGSSVLGEPVVNKTTQQPKPLETDRSEHSMHIFFF